MINILQFFNYIEEEFITKKFMKFQIMICILIIFIICVDHFIWSICNISNRFKQTIVASLDYVLKC